MDNEQFRELSQRVTLLEKELSKVQGEVSDVKQDTTELKEGTGELLDIMNGMKTGVKVIGGLGIAFKWLAGVIAAGISLWAAVKSMGGGSP